MQGPLSAGRARRDYRASDGQRWGVCEVEQAIPPGAPPTRLLIFDNPRIARRVQGVPADWQSLTDAELEAVRWRR